MVEILKKKEVRTLKNKRQYMEAVYEFGRNKNDLLEQKEGIVSGSKNKEQHKELRLSSFFIIVCLQTESCHSKATISANCRYTVCIAWVGLSLPASY